jgi:hypothetical protein
VKSSVEVAFPIVILAIVVAILASHPLIDPDLGWNLAGGLWIIDHLKVPTADPLAALGQDWVDYCFLPQILFAAVFKFLGFPGLIALQIILPVLMFACAGLFIFHNAEENSTLLKRLVPVVLAATLVLFIAPIFHLRPQLISAFLFLCFLQWRKTSENLLVLSVILILWANTHVYWIFGPVVLIGDYLLSFIFPTNRPRQLKRVGLALLLPLVSPYGLKSYLPIIQYSFFHSHVKELIQEFQPLLFTEGYLLPLTCVLFVTVVYQARCKLVSVEDLVLSLLFFILSLWQMKFTPIFGIFAVIALASRRIGQRRINLLFLNPLSI